MKLLFFNSQNEWTNSLIIRTYAILNSTDIWFINLGKSLETLTSLIFSKHVIRFKQVGYNLYIML